MEESKPGDRERMDALTESVELLLATVREQGVNFEKAVGQLISATNTNAQHISRLVGIIENHENRIARVEDRP